MDTNVEFILRLEKNFLSVEIQSIQADIVLPFDLYIFLPVNMKFFQYLRKGDSISKEKLGKFSKTNSTKLYVPVTQENELKNYISPAASSTVPTQATENDDFLKFNHIIEVMDKFDKKINSLEEQDFCKVINKTTLHIKDEIIRLREHIKTEDIKEIRIKDTTLKIQEYIAKIKKLSNVSNDKEKTIIKNVTEQIETFVDYVAQLPNNSANELNKVFQSITESTEDLTLTDEGKQIAGTPVEQKLMPLIKSLKAKITEPKETLNYEELRKELKQTQSAVNEIHEQAKHSEDSFLNKKLDSIEKMFGEIECLLYFLKAPASKEEAVKKEEIIKYDKPEESPTVKAAAENKDIDYQVHLIKTENEEIKKKHDYAVTEYKRLEESLQNMQKTNNDMEREIKRLGKELSNVKGEDNEDYKTKFLKASNELRTQETNSKLTQRELDREKQTTKKLMEDIAQMKKEKEEAGKNENSSEDVATKINKLSNDLRTQEANAKTTQRELEREKQTNKKLLEDVSRLQKDMEAYKSLKTEHARLTQLLANEQKKIKQLEEEKTKEAAKKAA